MLKNKFLKYSKLFLTVTLFLILPFVVFTVLTSKMEVFGIRSFVVLTGSMEPTLPVGSIVFTVKQPSYALGDIVSFRSGGVTVTHRVMQSIPQKSEFSYRVQGDANNSIDSQTVSSQNILGKQFLTLPYLGKLASQTKTPIGFVSLIVLPILLFIGLELLHIKKEIETHVEQKIRSGLTVVRIQ